MTIAGSPKLERMAQDADAKRKQPTTYQDLKNEIKLDDIAHDPWGTGISWLFSVCDVLTFERSCHIPNHWQFNPGISADTECYTFSVLNDASDETLIRFGNLLERFTRAARYAGKSY